MNDDRWIQTYTGRQFWPVDPKAEDLDVRDIAHALALRNRFGGHTRAPYSVAQHAVLVSYMVPEHSLWGLMHDAAEAYLPDVCRPLKPSVWVRHTPPGLDAPFEAVFEAFDDLEDALLTVIADWAGLPLPMPPAVAAADLALLAAEARQLMHQPPPAAWPALEGVQPAGLVILPWDWQTAERAFLVAWERLSGRMAQA